MALSKVDYNSLNVTAAASKALKWNSGADGLETGDVAGAMVLLDTFTSDGSDDTATFASYIDDTYKEYIFKFYSIHPETDDKNFQVNFRDGSTAYDATKTTTGFYVLHAEGGGTPALTYNGDGDQAQSTDFLKLDGDYGADADQSLSGYMYLFAPSDTTFIKHFMARTNSSRHVDQSNNVFTAGYCNVTAAIDGVQFKMSSGNIDSGVIKLYGIS